MKRFLQACEMTDSLYGKKRKTGQKSKSEKKHGVHKDLMSGYSRLYKSQLETMDRLFKRNQ